MFIIVLVKRVPYNQQHLYSWTYLVEEEHDHLLESSPLRRLPRLAREPRNSARDSADLLSKLTRFTPRDRS